MNSFPMFAKCYEHQAMWFDGDLERAARARAAFESVNGRYGVTLMWTLWSVGHMKTPLLAIKEDWT